jgi:hypothetical protein
MSNLLKNNDNSIQSHQRVMNAGLSHGLQQVSVGITQAIPKIVHSTENFIEDVRKLVAWQPTLTR